MMSQSSSTDIKTQLLRIVGTINKACVQGEGFNELGPLLHEGAVIATHGFAAHVRGPEACLRYYQDASSQMKFRKFDTSEEHVDTFDSTAVLSYRYNAVWEYQAKLHETEGHEVFVFVRDGGDWKLAWRTLIPGSRQTQVTAAEKPGANLQVSNDIRQMCLSLMAGTSACYLTTLDADGFPHTDGMNNLRYAREYPGLVDFHAGHDGNLTVFLTTSMQSDKIARLRANPKASVYFCDPDRVVGFMLGGEIEIVEDQRIRNHIWQKGWTMYYPNGPQGLEYAIIKLVPKVAKGWCPTGPFELTLKQEGETHV
jgi:general stress protein 26